MTTLGIQGFTGSPMFRTPPVFDGVQIADGIPYPLQRSPSRPANLLEHANGAVTVQLDYTDHDRPETLDAYSWSFPFSAREEPTWWPIFSRAKKRGSAVYWVTWEQEEEVFIVRPSIFVAPLPDLNTFTLPRYPASAVIAHGDLAVYPTRAFLDGTEQAVITTGDPGSGEVKIVGRTVTTPILTAGQELIVRAVWAYQVVVTDLPATYEAGRRFGQAVTLVEVGLGA